MQHGFPPQGIYCAGKWLDRKKISLCLAVISSLNLITPGNAFLLSSLQPTKKIISPIISMNSKQGASEVVPVTPCTRICRYNASIFDGQVCIGCFRDTFEISNWQSMNASEKYYTLLDACDRLEEASQIIDETASGTSRKELEKQAEFWKSRS